MEKVTEKKAKKPYFTSEDSWGDNIEKFYSLKAFLASEGTFEDLDECVVEFNYTSETGEEFSVDFNIDQLPMCCGVFEIGQLGSILPARTMNNLFRYLFEKKFTFIINTTKAHKQWEEYLESSDKFNKVKTFNNPNTGNEVTVWVSTN